MLRDHSLVERTKRTELLHGVLLCLGEQLFDRSSTRSSCAFHYPSSGGFKCSVTGWGESGLRTSGRLSGCSSTCYILSGYALRNLSCWGALLLPCLTRHAIEEVVKLLPFHHFDIEPLLNLLLRILRIDRYPLSDRRDDIHSLLTGLLLFVSFHLRHHPGEF